MSKGEVPMNLLQNVVFSLRYARKNRSWVVVVCPDVETTAQCRQVLAAAVSDQDKFSGRTVLLAGGGKVSVTVVDADVFIPEEDSFETLFAGWQAVSKKDARMTQWYKDTRAVLRECPL